MNYIEIFHKGKKTLTSVGTFRFDALRSVTIQDGLVEGFIPAGYEHRPDLISNLFLGSPSNWADILTINGISDPFEGFKLNDRVLLPDG